MYQGWTNKETWDVALILDNTEVLYNEARLRVQTEEDWQAADALKDMVETLVEIKRLVTPRELMMSQLLSTTLSRVDWRALVTHYREG